MRSDDLVDILNRLIQTSKDGEFGFRCVADNLKAVNTRPLFLQRAEKCRTAATELQALARRCGGMTVD